MKTIVAESDWIIELTSGYLAHPSGMITSDINEAYGYHYKKDAVERCKLANGFRAVRRNEARKSR